MDKEAVIVGKTRDACESMNSVGTFLLLLGIISIIIRAIILAKNDMIALGSYGIDDAIFIAAGAGMRCYARIKLAELEERAKQNAKVKKASNMESQSVEIEKNEAVSAEESEVTLDDMFFDDDDEYIPEPPISDDDPYADVKRLLRKQSQGNFYRRRR